MKRGKAALMAAAFACALGGAHSVSYAVDSASFEFAITNEAQMVRLATQWQWDRKWLRSNGAHIGGYWDLNLAQWHGENYRDIPGRTQNITSIGITPVFRWQNDNLKGFYAEAGIGAHYLSDHYNNNGDQLSTRFEFGDHIGLGYIFLNNLDLGLKIQHFSNGGIKHPNSGVDFVVIRVSYPL